MEIKTVTFTVTTTYREFKPGDKVKFLYPDREGEQGIFEVEDFVPPIDAHDDDAYVGLVGRKHRVQSRSLQPAI